MPRGIWVEGTELHIINEIDGSEWKYVGDLISNPTGAKLGSLWIENNDLHYIDMNGAKRKIPSVTMGTAIGEIGATWNNGKFLEYVDSLMQKRQAHTDIAHDDRAMESTAHNDNTITHTDNDTHSNYYYSSHSDSGSYSNNTTPHSDSTTSHGDNYWAPVHDDTTTHNDYFGNNAPHANNSPHSNSYLPSDHVNSYGDHSNTTGSHSNNDTHSNTTTYPYSDGGQYYNQPASHSDVAHADVPHYDVPYGDAPIRVT